MPVGVSTHLSRLVEPLFFVYEVSGELAGFYKTARHRANTSATWAHWRSRRNFRGTAWRAMVTQVSRRFAGAKRVELIVESDNTRGLAFYERLGFEIEGTLRKFYKRSHESAYVDDYILSRLFD